MDVTDPDFQYWFCQEEERRLEGGWEPDDDFPYEPNDEPPEWEVDDE